MSATRTTPTTMSTTTSASATADTTLVKVLDVVEQIVLDPSAIYGSVVAVDTANDLTTIAIGGNNPVYNGTLTITQGPSTIAFNHLDSIVDDDLTEWYSLSQTCEITSSALSAICLYSEWPVSDQGSYTGISPTAPATVPINTAYLFSLSANEFAYDILTLTAGLSKLPASASATATSTATATATATAAATTTSSTTSSSSSSSKAWIAGPVIGSVCGVALLALGAWWYLRRRNRKTPAEAPGTQGYQQQQQQQQMEQAPPYYDPYYRSKQMSELLSPNSTKHEMPPVELPPTVPARELP
ncbi:hypothetical protein ASPZODRAFT_133959 [Penicilliopsis zonata CBS 506.65]|uniref:Mid2 domain-containing protein n=1 Tax=Penicilliopsis zonata CBS 506.65 TaxID=1073090 RepID=A0A1L9SDX4_9EURO|nr:hypothetical protein ASPZODRAFT_133959 [Penicilliopsis zonata CBS 506.65]OJJ45313.1 hypothetical protein ASPZODRAFT_133959 [Penicilliopsis zonata CBS 506.65]